MKSNKKSQSITERNESINRYFDMLKDKKCKPLTPDQEAELARLMHQGDQAARDLLIISNLRFVVTEAKKHLGNGLSLDDLIAEGNVGLIQAAEKFDETRGFKFISYAVHHIKKCIYDAITNSAGAIRVAENAYRNSKYYEKIREALRQELQREPSDDEVAERACELEIGNEMEGQLTPQQVARKLKTKHGQMLAINNKGIVTRGLDDPLGDDPDSGTVQGTYIDEDGKETDEQVANDTLADFFHDRLKLLTERQRYVIIRTFGLEGHQEMSTHSVAVELGLTDEAVRQAKVRALKTLKGDEQVRAEYASRG